MVRVDVFEKGGKYYLVPIYSWQAAQGILPNKAIIAFKDEAEWQIIDDSYQFKFTAYPNDLVEVQSKKGTIFGYYVGLNRATGAIDIREHDTDIYKGKNGIFQSIGVKTALSFQKYQIANSAKPSPFAVRKSGSPSVNTIPAPICPAQGFLYKEGDSMTWRSLLIRDGKLSLQRQRQP